MYCKLNEKLQDLLDQLKAAFKMNVKLIRSFI